MNTYMLRRGKPPVTGVVEFQRVQCRGVRNDSWYWEDRTPCPHAAVHVVDGVACCGKHRRQVDLCKISRRTFMPDWFVNAAVLSPQEAELLLGKEKKRSIFRRRSRRALFVMPAIDETRRKGK